MDMLTDILCETASDEDKPVFEILRNSSRIVRLCGALMDYVKAAIPEDDKSIPRERAVRVNAVFMPIIESLEQFVEENV